MRKYLKASFFIGIFSVISITLTAQLTFNVASATVDCESSNVIPVEITVENFNNIGNMQFGVTWDTSILQYDQVTNQLPPSPLFIETSTSVGELRFGWLDANPPFTGENLPDGTAIITMFFTRIGNGGSTSSIELTSFPDLNFQVADGGGVIIPMSQITINNGSVAIFDNVNPTLQNCPTNQTVNVAINDNMGTASWTPPTASDNCAIATFGSNFMPGDSFTVGTTTVTYTAEDFGGNTAICSFDVTVNQTTNPNAVRFELEMASIDCAEDSIVLDLKVFNFNNISSFQFGLEWDTSIVRYRIHRNFLPPAAVFFENDPDSTNIAIRWSDFSPPIGQDIADNTTIVSLVFDLEGLGGDSTFVEFVNLPSFPIEVTVNSVPLPDADFVLTDGLINLSDTEAPSIICPTDVTVNVPSGTTQMAANWALPTTSDDCHVASVTSNFMPGDSFPIGTTVVSYIVIDNAANTNNCSFNVNVTSNPAAGMPTFILEQENIECTTDSVVIDLLVADFDNLSSFQFNVEWDTSIVRYRIHRNFLPPAANFFGASPDSTNIGIRWADFSIPIGESLPDSMVIVSLVFDVVGGLNMASPFQFSGDTAFPIEVTRNSIPLPSSEFNLVDGSINVMDNAAPIIADCPADITVTAPVGTTSIPVNWTAPTASDNCNLVSFNSNFNPNDNFNIGTTQVQYIAIDAANNSDTCTFNVIVVEDNMPNPRPEFTSCPMDTVLSVSDMMCATTHTWDIPTLNSTAGLDSLVNSHDPGDSFRVGLTTVSYIAFSAQGNDTCSFLVDVRDSIPPIIENCPNDTTIFADPVICAGVVNWTPVVITDNCGIADLLQTHQPDNEFPIGTLPVLIIPTDSSGNRTICTFEVTVIDTIMPFFDDCPGTVEVLVDGTVISDPDATIIFSETDNCSGARIFFVPPIGRDTCIFATTSQIDTTGLASGSSFPVGTHNLIYEAVDNAGNQAFCNFEIIIHPLPTINVEANGGAPICEGEEVIIRAFEPGMGYTYSWTGPNMFTSMQSVDTIPAATINNNGTYTLVANSPNGCPITVDLNVQVNSGPDVEISNNDILCADGSNDLNLMATDNANANVITWQWSGPQMFDSSIQNPTITNAGLNEAGIYTVTGTTDQNCSDTAQVEILISTTPPVPSLDVTDNDFELCVGESTTITGTQFMGANASQQWFESTTTGFNFIGLGTNVRTYSFLEPGTYIISYFATVNGCSSDTTSVTINVASPPIIDLTTNAPILCSDDTQTLTLGETFGNADGYNWTGPNNFNETGQTQTIPNVVSANAGTYILTAISGDGCTSIDSVEVEISSGPSPILPSIEPSDSVVCLGDSIVLFGLPYNDPNGVTYTWFQRLELTGNLINISSDRVITVQPTSTGEFEYLYIANVGGCVTDTASISITVGDQPIANIESNAPLICVADGTDLVFNENGGSATSWSWTGPSGFISMDQNASVENVTESNAGIYEVTITNDIGCSVTTSLDVEITEGIGPISIELSDSIFCEDIDTLILTTTIIPNATYSWSGPVPINNTGSRVVIPFPTLENAGAYTVEVTAENGCTATTATPANVEILTAPSAVDDYVLVLFESSIEIDVLGNDTFFNDRPVTINAITETIKGTLEDRKDGTFRYTPDEKQLGEDVFIYEICYDECPMLCARAEVTFDIKHDPNQCVIPSVITPNNDGRNDMLIVSCVEAGTFPDNEIVIFNEWGDEVFNAAPYNNDWGGTWKGQALPDGTYYYLFFRTPGGEPQKGFITIFR